jgi:nicotinamidase-related amidase
MSKTIKIGLIGFAAIIIASTSSAFTSNPNPFTNLKTTKMEQFTPQNAAIILVDHQKSTMNWIYSQDRNAVENNLVMLARLGNDLKTPLLITTTMEDFVGPTFEGIQKAAPKQHANRIKRGGTINCFLDPSFNKSVKDLGRKKLIIAGLTTDICLLQTVKGAIAEGYDVIVVSDASGSMTKMADEVSFDYFRQIGVQVFSSNAVLAELYPDFGTPEGQKAMQISIDEVVSKLGK